MSDQKSNKGKNSFAKECMFMALKKLLCEKKPEEITVSELAKEAGISRTTFYRNYDSITGIIVDYFDIFPFSATSSESYSPEKFSLEGRLRDSLSSLKKNRDVFESLFRFGNGMIIYDCYESKIKGECRERAFDIGFRSEYELAAFAGMYFGICYDWITGGMQESVDEMVDICYEILHTFYKNDDLANPERDNVYVPKHRK